MNSGTSYELHGSVSVFLRDFAHRDGRDDISNDHHGGIGMAFLKSFVRGYAVGLGLAGLLIGIGAIILIFLNAMGL